MIKVCRRSAFNSAHRLFRPDWSDEKNNAVFDKCNHRNLNLDCPEFEQLNPTAENIAAVIYKLMRQAMDKKYELSITLWETENNIVYFDGK